MTKEKIGIWGSASGSTYIELGEESYKRVILTVTTDFSRGRGILDKNGVRQLRDALNEILKEQE